MEFHQVSEKSYLQHGSQYILIQLKKHIFVERIYQLRNFDANFMGCYLSCLLLQTYHQIELILGNWQLASCWQMKYLETNLICILNVISLLVGMQDDIAYEICKGWISIQKKNCCSYIYEHEWIKMNICHVFQLTFKLQ